MIKNDQQMQITERKLASMRDRLVRLRRKYASDVDYDFYSEASRQQIVQMERELEHYQLARAGNVDAIITLWNERGRLRPDSKDDLSLGDFISLVRVARGLTQQHLAKVLGIEQAHVARYECREYSGYSVKTLDRILSALGVRLTLGKADLPRAA